MNETIKPLNDEIKRWNYAIEQYLEAGEPAPIYTDDDTGRKSFYYPEEDEYFKKVSDMYCPYWIISNKTGRIISFYNPEKPRLLKPDSEGKYRSLRNVTFQNVKAYRIVADTFDVYKPFNCPAWELEVHHIYSQIDRPDLKYIPWNMQLLPKPVHLCLTQMKKLYALGYSSPEKENKRLASIISKYPETKDKKPTVLYDPTENTIAFYFFDDVPKNIQLVGITGITFYAD